MPRRGNVRNLGRMECREACGGANLAGEIQVRRVAHALDRNHVGEAGIGIDVPANDVEEVHQAAVLEHMGNLQAVAGAKATGQVFIAGVAHPEQEILTAALADTAQHLEGEAHAVFQRTTVRAIEIVGQWRPELIHEVPVRLQFQAIETGGLHAFGGVHIILDDPIDVPVFHLFREGPVGRFPAMGR